LKEGELMKIGKSTNMMQERYYILRDYTLFVYKDQYQKHPSNLIILKGTYIDLLEFSKEDKYFGFSI
jgi:hypothetical protein